MLGSCRTGGAVTLRGRQIGGDGDGAFRIDSFPHSIRKRRVDEVSGGHELRRDPAPGIDGFPHRRRIEAPAGIQDQRRRPYEMRTPIGTREQRLDSPDGIIGRQRLLDPADNRADLDAAHGEQYQGCRAAGRFEHGGKGPEFRIG